MLLPLAHDGPSGRRLHVHGERDEINVKTRIPVAGPVKINTLVTDRTGGSPLICPQAGGGVDQGVLYASGIPQCYRVPARGKGNFIAPHGDSQTVRGNRL